MHRPVSRPLDVFIDLTDDEPAGAVRNGRLTRWPDPDRLTMSARHVTCVVRPRTWSRLSSSASALGWTIISSESAIRPCSDAIARSATDMAPLLLLRGPVEVTDEVLFAMRRCLMRDPMFGCVAARVRCADGCCFRRPSCNGQMHGHWIPRQTLAELDEMEVSPELFESCLLLAAPVAAEFGALDQRFSTLAGALLHLLSRARRCGYRTVLANRAVVAIAGVSCGDDTRARPVPDPDQALLRRLTPELERGWEQFRAASNERFEILNGQAHRSTGTGRRSLLIDARNVTAGHNGTSHAVLGCVAALRRLSPSWHVTVVAHEAAVAFHGLRELCRGWELTTVLPTSPFTTALRLSQPWHIQEMIDLHQAALFNIYFLLDSISWDVIYPPPEHLDGTWSFLVDNADGLLFDSHFTEQRFLARFDRASDVPRAVCHYPFDRAEYLPTRVMTRNDPHTPSYILVVGNELDHKDSLRTLELLSMAFPFQSLVSLGPPVYGLPNLRALKSGALSEGDVGRLYADARVVVFPSFYEGFGFPIVTALAHGKTLVARRSQLLEEIAARCSTGRLIAFDRRDELVDILGRLLHGEAVPSEPLGSAVTEKTRQWSDVAVDLMALVDSVSLTPARSRWLKRERSVSQLRAFRT